VPDPPLPHSPGSSRAPASAHVFCFVFVGARSENEKAGCISLVSRYLR
jgi:hypothetical protein